jgi:hypothetical protein
VRVNAVSPGYTRTPMIATVPEKVLEPIIARTPLGRLAEVRDIERTLAGDAVPRIGFQVLLEPKMARILLMGITLAVLQQWSGINSIFNYAEEIYRSAGYGISDIMFNIVITGTIKTMVGVLVLFAGVDILVNAVCPGPRKNSPEGLYWSLGLSYHCLGSQT